MPELVDLGLPSGTLWARTNLGARTETEYGDYFSWGNLIGHSESEGYNFNEANYRLTPGSKIENSITWLNDPVYAMFGGSWSMASRQHAEELLAYTGSEWVRDYQGSGINGRLFTSLVNGEQLFIPAGGRFVGTEHRETTSFCVFWLRDKVSRWVSLDVRIYSSSVYFSERWAYEGCNVRPIVVGPRPVIVPSQSVQLLNLSSDE